MKLSYEPTGSLRKIKMGTVKLAQASLSHEIVFVDGQNQFSRAVFKTGHKNEVLSVTEMDFQGQFYIVNHPKSFAIVNHP